MQKHLVEIKARTQDHHHLRATLTQAGADFRGTDHQIDRYFRVPEGRLKLRIGNIERSLIFYRRPNQAGPKDSSVSLTVLETEREAVSLARTLERALGLWVTVDKQREIYFIDNVKFHLDTVAGLGTFVEIEAIGDAEAERGRLLEQVDRYRKLLDIAEADFVSGSYSDLLLPPADRAA
ncbi:putative adenylyl cyclase CyaB [Neolewinella xylanilytica]|uniref:Putative adenylyl cyclase CyaB n=1 Tax=Neolewinella xylanilytica TaxID=1514080 RepID=A0A2S6I1P1_9BACT|nr:class IV adenylate cyclase [Neolewinella xylanilytica]PPK84791.1 putative adenylyl cyclase CyaB [Neolewinella xylanilytica]